MDQEAKADSLDLQASVEFGNVNGFNLPKINAIMTNEEMKIRGELEMEIERDLEQEIKDGIYHLALRLHRLYEHQKERESARESGSRSRQEKRNKIISELTISIRVEGGTKIEIKETKKQVPELGRPRTSARSDIWHGPGIARNTRKKKFDWANSLRSSGDSSSPMSTNRKTYERSDQSKSLKNGKILYSDGNDRKVVELGWKW